MQKLKNNYDIYYIITQFNKDLNINELFSLTIKRYIR